MKKMFLAGLLTITAVSQAAVTAFLDSTASLGANTVFNYHIEQTTGDILRTNDFFTLYDIQGFVSATGPADFSVSIQNLGVNPSTPVGDVAPGTDSMLPNVSFINVGANTNAMSISGFQVVSTLAGSGGMLAFTGQNAKETGLETTNGSLGAVPGPSAVPEPGSWVMLASGLGALAYRLRSRIA